MWDDGAPRLFETHRKEGGCGVVGAGDAGTWHLVALILKVLLRGWEHTSVKVAGGVSVGAEGPVVLVLGQGEEALVLVGEGGGGLGDGKRNDGEEDRQENLGNEGAAVAQRVDVFLEEHGPELRAPQRVAGELGGPSRLQLAFLLMHAVECLILLRLHVQRDGLPLAWCASARRSSRLAWLPWPTLRKTSSIVVMETP